MSKEKVKFLVEEISAAISGMLDALPNPVAGSVSALCKQYKKDPYKKRERKVQ